MEIKIIARLTTGPTFDVPQPGAQDRVEELTARRAQQRSDLQHGSDAYDGEQREGNSDPEDGQHYASQRR